MAKEIEVRILGISPALIRRKLRSLGAKKTGVLSLRRFVYDLPGRGKIRHRWLRLRDDGAKATLTLKEIAGRKIGDVDEREVGVSDFDKAARILSALGFKPVAYQENLRERWMRGTVEIDIDSWPKMPPYLEIEAKKKADLERMVNLLGFSMDDTTTLTTAELYAKRGMRLHDFKVLKF